MTARRGEALPARVRVVVPRWEGRPSKAAFRAGLTWEGPRDVWEAATSHVEVVWASAFMVTGGRDDMAFGARVALHAQKCGECQTGPAMLIWEAVLPAIGLEDVLKAHGVRKRK